MAARQRNAHLTVNEDARAQRAALLAQIRRDTGRGHEVAPEPMPEATVADPDGVALMTSAKDTIVNRKGKISKETAVDSTGALME